MSEEILDPAHDDSLDQGTSMGVAGVPSPEPDADKGAAAPKVSDDGNILEHGGKKYITVEAFQSERRGRQELADTLARLDPVMPEFEEFLNTRQSRRQQTRDRVASDTGGVKDDPEYLNEVAIALGWYDEQNQPDQRRAQSHLNITRREAERTAGRVVKPLADTTARERASAHRERARGSSYVDGRPVADQRYIDAAFDALPPEMAADTNIANITQVIAAGLEYLDQRKNGTLPRTSRAGREPMMLERGGGRFESSDEISDLDRAAARARGKTPEQWAKLSKQVNPSNRGTAVLEDI